MGRPILHTIVAASLLGISPVAVLSCGTGRTAQPSADAVAAAGQVDTLGAYEQTGDTAPVRDPSVMRQGGVYYVFSTDTGGSGKGHIAIRCSTDKQSWSACGYVFGSLPSWIAAAVAGASALWAPDISYFGGQYHVYYAASLVGTQSSVIGEATNVTLDPASSLYQWVDQGEVIASQPGGDFNAIDPSIFVDTDGSVWMSYGSYWSGIKQVSIDPATGKVAGGGATVYSLASQPDQPNGALEGSSMVRQGEYYYLFASKGLCCQGDPTQDTYEQIVGRSRSPQGPFLDETGLDMMVGGGTTLLAKNASWNAPGGGTAHIDAATGESLLVFHAPKTGSDPTAYLWVKQISWVGDWPVLGPIPGAVQ